ncbi:MAG TPA: transporter [Terriglobales bacterium]
MLRLILLLLPVLMRAQTLAPRAYLITPVDSNAATLSTNIYNGAILFDSTVPITGASGNIVIFSPTFYHSLSFFGRSANITAGLPYAVGTFEGKIVDQQENLYRSGLGDGFVRFSVNLKGGPAMKVPQFLKWKQKRLLGVSLLVSVPTGQYDPTKLVNIGDNRWAFKPEFGYSERWGKWILDAYAACWFFTPNPEFFSRNPYYPGTRSQSQESIGAFETHLSYDFKPRLWASIDGNFWVGGITSLNGIENPLTLQRNSRIGATAAFPISRHQALKFSYANGAYIRFGGDYQAITAAWQYSWIGRRIK